MRHQNLTSNIHWKKGQARTFHEVENTEDLTVRIQLSGEINGEVLTLNNQEGKCAIALLTTEDDTGSELTVKFYTSAFEEPLYLTAPLGTIGKGDTQIVLRFRSEIIELFVDGQLVDEDWPIGTVSISDQHVKVGNMVQEFNVWKGILSDDELDLIFGIHSSEQYHQKLHQINDIQYWKPPGHNTKVGDCMPFYDGEKLRLFYLYDRKGHKSKWGLGAHQWAQLASEDLKEWTDHSIAVGITEQWEGSICTGSILYEKGKYYAFYAVRMSNQQPAQLTWAESDDGIHFNKRGKVIPMSSQYHQSSIRDPMVFKDADGLFHMFVTTSDQNHDHNDRSGCLAHLVSEDLSEWKELEPFIVPGYKDQPECADYFEWNGWYYLIFSNHGAARYLYSKSAFGPWKKPTVDMIDGPQYRVPKTAAFKDNRRIVAGFLSSHNEYGGKLILRELVQSEDGTLGTKFVPEITPADDLPVNSCTLQSVNGYSGKKVFNTTDDYHFSFEAIVKEHTSFFGFSTGETADKSGNSATEVLFDISMKRVSIRQDRERSWEINASKSLFNVDLNCQVIKVEGTVQDGVIDICVNDSRTLISILENKGDSFQLFVQHGEVEFLNIKNIPILKGEQK